MADRNGAVAVDGEVMEREEQLAVMPATGVEVDVQVSTAKKYPRSIRKARDEAMSMALTNEEVAASCCYTLSRQGKAIKGPSVRLAEIMAQAWGNLRCETRTLNADHRTVEAEAVVWDLEKNTAYRAAVKRRITSRDGRRYNDDMIVTTGNAASSIAFRNALFRVIPKTFVHEVYDACERVAVGDIQTLDARRTKALEYFARFGINSTQVAKRMGRDAVDQLTIDDVAQLKAMAEQIRRGDLTIEDAFADPEKDEPPAATSAASVADSLLKQAAAMPAPTPAALATPNDPPETPEQAARRDEIESGEAFKVKPKK